MKVPYEYAHSDELTAAYLKGYLAVVSPVQQKEQLKQMIEKAIWQAFRLGHDCNALDDEHTILIRRDVANLVARCQDKVS